MSSVQGESSKLSFSITSGDPNSQFKFPDAEKGDIIIASSLDREAIPSYEVRFDY